MGRVAQHAPTTPSSPPPTPPPPPTALSPLTMGAGASTLDTSTLPSKCSEEDLKKLLGDKYDEEAATAFLYQAEENMLGEKFGSWGGG